MTIGLICLILNFGAALAALAAAFLWYRSAAVTIPFKDAPDASGMYRAAIVIDGNVDFIDTAQAQTMWSKRAASAAAIAAALQGMALLMQSISLG
jgi:hypothetical protein